MAIQRQVDPKGLVMKPQSGCSNNSDNGTNPILLGVALSYHTAIAKPARTVEAAVIVGLAMAVCTHSAFIG